MFTFKGISTKDMKIIVEEPENLIAKAPLKHEVLNIEGRDDAIYYPLGYAPIEISLTLQLLDPSKIDEVLMWLDGEGELIYKDRKTKARIYSEIQPIRTSGIRIINIEVIRSPFWYALEDDYSEAWGANLIPNGWDSFSPYGSGENYVKNWDFHDDSHWNGHMISMEIRDGKAILDFTKGTLWGGIAQQLDFEDSVYIVRIKAKVIYGGDAKEVAIQWGSTIGKPKYLGKKWEVIEWEISPRATPKNFYFYQRPSNETENIIEVDWISISKKDNQHLIVEKTPLENGLTRIQTWGGNNNIKLLKSIGRGHDGELSLSTYVKPNNTNGRIYFQGVGIGNNIDIEKHLVITGPPDPRANVQFRVVTHNVNRNLDFIASTPTIVEGDTPPTWEADENPRIINEGTAPSKPLIKLTKGTTNTCEFEVNGVYFKYHFNNDDHVLIDCDKMEASDNGQLRNRHLTIGFEFPVLEPGPNVVKRISGDAKIEFSRKDRWL